MTCPDEDSLSDFLTGSADAAVAEFVEQHITACSSCLDTLEELQQSSPTPIWQQTEVSAYSSEEAFKNALSLVQRVPFDESHSNSRHGQPSADLETIDSLEFSKLGDYRILECLGHGGMGRVYKAIHTKLDKTVAIKTIASSAKSKSKTQRVKVDTRFQQESKAIGRLDHPNIVRATDARIIDGTRFLVMEFVEGKDLSEIVRANGPFSIDDAVEVVLQVANGLKHAHENGIVHRDIKPRNIMVSSADGQKVGTVKLLDLGLATLEQDSNVSDVTGTDGNFVGTPDYLAPEQATVGGHVDERSDIYSLGCTLYFLLAGEPPFRDAASTQAKLLSHTTKVPTELTVLRPDLAVDAMAEIDAVLKKMMAKSLDIRYQSVDEVIGALSACGSNSTNGSNTDSRTGNRTSSKSKHELISSADSGRQSYIAWPLMALAAIGCVVMLATVLTLKLSKGTLIVEASPDVEVSVLGDKVRVIDTNTERKFLLSIGESRLKPGEYKIVAEDIGQDYTFSSDAFSIVRGEETRISVRLKKGAPAKLQSENVIDDSEPLPPKTDSEVAVWLFGQGAKRLRVMGHDKRITWIHNRLEIPRGCQILAIDVRGLKSFGDEELKQVAHLQHLSHLDLHDTSVTNVGMGVIGTIPTISHIDVSMISSLTEGGFRSLASLPALSSLRYVRASVSAEEIKAIAELSKLSVVALNVRDLPDAALQPLTRLTDLQNLTLENSTVDGSFTEFLIGCKKLRHLDIYSDHLDAEKASPIGQLTQLDHLNISCSGVDSGFLSRFNGLTNLETVIFVQSGIGDDDAEFFRKLPKLKSLELRLSEVSDDFVARLGIVPSLRTLNLADTNLTDASVEHLAKMSQLQTLYVGRTQLTKSGITELVRSLPHCHIHYDGR